MSSSEPDLHRSFLRLFSSSEPSIRAFIRRLVPSRADADDIMQEVSIVLWEKFESFQEGGDFRAWAFGVSRYEVLAWLRDKGRDRIVLNEKVVDLLADESMEREAHLSRQREALEVCIEKVAPDQRDLLMRAYQPNAQIRSIAQESGRTESGFYQWLYRIRRSLLDCIRRNLEKGVAS
ncbi:MAG: RNA polymerase subunit sigma [Verrucomicrobiales bacterium]|nr:RNA polymerase subunit sigma [Verrucomicrobiales bacterium]